MREITRCEQRLHKRHTRITPDSRVRKALSPVVFASARPNTQAAA